MKPNAVFINVGRGKCVDEEALIQGGLVLTIYNKATAAVTDLLWLGLLPWNPGCPSSCSKHTSSVCGECSTHVHPAYLNGQHTGCTC
jgi:hypothetical protein